MNIKEIKEEIERIHCDVLNREQRVAVNAILAHWSSGEDFVLPIVDGPPGTGKTYVGTVATAKYLLENPRGKVSYLCYTHFATDCAWNMLKSFGFTRDYVMRVHHDPRRTNLREGIVGSKRRDLGDLSASVRMQLEGCGVLLCTLHGSPRVFSAQSRPKVIVDEFSQVSPAMFFKPLY